MRDATRFQDPCYQVGRFGPVIARREFPLSGAHAEKLAGLPPIRKDPFDRMLVAQSFSEPLILLTNDTALAAYGEGVRVV